MKKFGRDNRGLSLVELIVSVAILAVIVLPLLSSFVTSSRTNAKAKNKLRATNVAENVMEGMEAMSVKEFAYEFNYPEEGFLPFSLSDDSTVMQVIPTGSTYARVTKREDIDAVITNPEDLISSAILKDLSGTGYKFLESADHKYYFYATNLKSDNKKYNAFITLDAKTDVVGSINRVYNTTELADMTKMDTNYDAINANKDTVADVLNAIHERGYAGVQQSDISRTIKVDIDKNVSGATTVRVTYSYEFNYAGNHIKFPLEGAENEKNYTSIIYDNSFNTDCYLREVYLFYQPWYTSHSTSGYMGCTDNIIINNNKSIPCEVSIIKQNCVDASVLVDKENNYNVFVEISEISNSTDKAVTELATNIDINLGNSSSAVQPNQAYYMFNNNVNQSQVRSKLKISGLDTVKKEDRLYDVKVEIYNSRIDLSKINTENPTVTFTGSMVE